jgi:hypothetical protein
MMIMMMLMILTKIMTITCFCVKDIILVNYLSILSIRIMIEVGTVHGLHTQKFI